MLYFHWVELIWKCPWMKSSWAFPLFLPHLLCLHCQNYLSLCELWFLALLMLSLQYICSPFLDYNLLNNRDDHIGQCVPGSSNSRTCSSFLCGWFSAGLMVKGFGFWWSEVGVIKSKAYRDHFNTAHILPWPGDSVGWSIVAYTRSLWVWSPVGAHT